MRKIKFLASLFTGGLACLLATVAFAELFNIPAGDLKGALDVYAKQTGVELVVSAEALNGARTKGAKGELSPDDALTRILAGTGFVVHRHASGAIGIMRDVPRADDEPLTHIAAAPAASAPGAALETVTVTSSKIGGDVQNIPISITALSQEQLTTRQIAGGPDLVKEVPNLTFSKTNFTGYNIQIRGIGTQAISVTTDPAVAVAFNDIPFIRNHFFEQEFYDLSQAEVLRGPQGTLYGRNATAGVVNIVSAKPTDQFEAMASVDIGNYQNRRLEGMINVPIVDDRVDLRVAGEWTKRDGYSFNELTDARIDGRDLWSTRVTLGLHPTSKLQAYLVWEHFSEDDDRMRTAKQLCKTAPTPTSVGGVPLPAPSYDVVGSYELTASYMSQGCEAASLYSPDSFEVPNGFSLPYLTALGVADLVNSHVDPYVSAVQSQNLRVIESALNPHYRAKNDTLELNADYVITPTLSFTSQTGYNQDFLWSTEDYNRFNTTPGIFLYPEGEPPGNDGLYPDPSGLAFCGDNGCTDGLAGAPGAPCAFVAGNNNDCQQAAVFCDPQLGCSDRIVGEDLSDERAWQLSQEFRLTSNFSGPFNFSIGGNYLHYETEENYYVFINALSAYSRNGFGGDNGGSTGGLTNDNSDCFQQNNFYSGGWQNLNPGLGGGEPSQYCLYVDPNSISSLNNEGHNYFLSQNPYVLNSYAGFGEVYYNVAGDLKLTGGLRWTDDQKHFIDIPSEVITQGYGYPVTGIVDQRWGELTGRAAANWTPKLDFTDQTLVYGSYAHGYKAGGANPPGAEFPEVGGSDIPFPIHPLTFKPEFINAYELGTKNTLLDGSLTLNGDIFYYDYKGYQISEIVDRTSINLNFDAKVHGAELETSWEPVPGLKFGFAGGYEDTRIDNGQSAIDLMDRTDAANHPDWLVVKPFPTEPSNCILPVYVIQALLEENRPVLQNGSGFACGMAYTEHLDPVTLYPYQANPTGPANIGYNGCSLSGCDFSIPAGYPGFDPTQSAINNGAGFAKNLGGNQLPNAPHFTTSLTAEYTLPISEDWAATLHSDLYWQSQSFARVFNDRPYDKIRGYSNVNLALILTGASGWQVMGYLKNVFNTTAITGDFLNSDDSGLTTNVFLTDPRLYGVRVTKNL
jgi:iron complex outermembrane receptor protein